jgi:hypothetical protein
LREVVGVAAGVAVEAVGRVARAGGHVGAVDRLDGGDVVHQRGRGVDRGREVEVEVPRPGLGGGEIGHDAVGPAVLVILGVGRVGDVDAGGGVVVAGMLQPQGVAAFVGQGVDAVEALVQLEVAGLVGADPDIAGDQVGVVGRVVVRQVGIGLGAGPVGVVGEGDVGLFGRGLHQGRGDQVVPAGHRLPGGGLLVFGERREAEIFGAAVQLPVLFVDIGLGEHAFGGVEAEVQHADVAVARQGMLDLARCPARAAAVELLDHLFDREHRLVADCAALAIHRGVDRPDRDVQRRRDPVGRPLEHREVDVPVEILVQAFVVKAHRFFRWLVWRSFRSGRPREVRASAAIATAGFR